MSEPIYAHRFESQRFSYTIDADADIFGVTDPKIEHREFRILKFTPKGFWIEYGFGSKKFVLDGCRRQYAHLKESEALAALIERKKAHVRHASKRLEDAKMHLAAAEAYSAQRPFISTWLRDA